MRYKYSNDGININIVETPIIIDLVLFVVFILGILKLLHFININGQILLRLFSGIILFYCVFLVICFFTPINKKIPLVKRKRQKDYSYTGTEIRRETKNGKTKVSIKPISPEYYELECEHYALECERTWVEGDIAHYSGFTDDDSQKLYSEASSRLSKISDRQNEIKEQQDKLKN
jgi:hypothetical protein